MSRETIYDEQIELDRLEHGGKPEDWESPDTSDPCMSFQTPEAVGPSYPVDISNLDFGPTGEIAYVVLIHRHENYAPECSDRANVPFFYGIRAIQYALDSSKCSWNQNVYHVQRHANGMTEVVTFK